MNDGWNILFTSAHRRKRPVANPSKCRGRKVTTAHKRMKISIASLVSERSSPFDRVQMFTLICFRLVREGVRLWIHRFSIRLSRVLNPIKYARSLSVTKNRNYRRSGKVACGSNFIFPESTWVGISSCYVVWFDFPHAYDTHVSCIRKISIERSPLGD